MEHSGEGRISELVDVVEEEVMKEAHQMLCLCSIVVRRLWCTDGVLGGYCQRAEGLAKIYVGGIESDCAEWKFERKQ